MISGTCPLVSRFPKDLSIGPESKTTANSEIAPVRSRAISNGPNNCPQFTVLPFGTCELIARHELAAHYSQLLLSPSPLGALGVRELPQFQEQPSAQFGAQRRREVQMALNWDISLQQMWDFEYGFKKLMKAQAIRRMRRPAGSDECGVRDG